MNPILALPYSALAAVASGIARFPLPGQGKVLRALRGRRGVVERMEQWAQLHRDSSRPLLWMHAPSVGEGLQARPVLEIIRERRPDVQIAYTYFSPSAERFAATLDVDLAEYLPFDTGAAARRVIRALRPDALVFAKLDLWPTLAATAARGGVRLGMISATLAAGSRRQSALARALLRDAYAALDRVGTVDSEDGARLVALGVNPDRLAATGDTRYDQVAARAAGVDRSSPMLATLASPRPTLVAGSTWPADEEVIALAWRTIRREIPDARLILAPHEPTEAHLAPLERWARSEGLSITRLGTASATDDVVLVDRLGVLGDLYALADVAYVGGGFHSAGLHSVLEPAAFGVPVLFGPRHANSRDATLLITAKGGESVTDIASLARALRIALTEDDTRSNAGTAARDLVQRGLGAAKRSADLVESLLPPALSHPLRRPGER